MSRLGAILDGTGGHVVGGSDTSRYLVAADVMITDHSSVGFEYLLLDRPVIRIDMPELIARTNVSVEYVDLLREAAITIRSSNEVLGAVERALADPSGQADARRAVAAEVFYAPGTATRRAVRELYDVLELDPAVSSEAGA